MHPDGSYGGEYGSRNTYHFYPHGFELFADRVPEAAFIADRFLRRAMPERRRYVNEDNRMLAHYVYDWMQAWEDHQAREGEVAHPLPTPGQEWFPEGQGLRRAATSLPGERGGQQGWRPQGHLAGGPADERHRARPRDG